MDQIRVGIIGAGAMAEQHLNVMQAMDGMHAAGITSRTKSKAAALAGKYQIPVCADGIDDLMARARPDALMVLVSPDQTYEVVKQALALGCPLFIEKPAGLSVEEGTELASLARQQGVPTMVGFNRRYYSVFHQGLEIIKRHGPLLGLRVEGHERMWLHRAAQPARSEAILSRWIFVNSVHTIDLLRFFGGEPRQVTAIARRYLEPQADQIAAVMEFPGGAIGQYSAHWYSPGGWGVALYGQGVTVEFKPLEQGQWTDKNFKAHSIDPDEWDTRFKPGFYRQMQSFADMVRSGKSPWPAQDLGGSLQTMLLVQAMTGNAIHRNLTVDHA